MTDSTPPLDVGQAPVGSASASASAAGTDGPPPPSVRAGTFSLEGRRAPGLYLVGWLASLLGGATFVATLVSGTTGPGALVLVVGSSLVLAVGLIAAAGAQAIERRDRTDLAYRGPSPFLLFAAGVPLAVLFSLPVSLLGFRTETPIGTLLTVVATDVPWLLLLGLTVVGTSALRWREIGAGTVGVRADRIAADVAWGILAAGPVLAVTLLATAVLVALIGVAPEGAIPVPRSGADFALVLLAAAVIAPIGEELFYRGFATTAWARAIGPTGAIIRGALFFAFAHIVSLGGSDFGHAGRVALVAFLARVPIALALGWIFLRRGSLPASIALHATFNALIVVLATRAA